MAKKLVSLLISLALLLTLFIVPAGATGTSKTYLIAFQNELPVDYTAVIQQIGGTVLKAMPEIAGLEVSSADPEFLNKLKSLQGIQAANIELTHKIGAMPSASQPLSLLSATSSPAEPDYWNYQWDMQRVTNNGASYSMETGGSVLPDGSVSHKAVVGIIDTGIDANHPDIKNNLVGGQSFVPAGFGPGETGDPADIRDRTGHGTFVAGVVAANGKIKGVGPNLGIRAYRVFANGGMTSTSWMTDAMLQAVKDHVDVINTSFFGLDCLSGYTVAGETYSDVADSLLWKRTVQYALNHNVAVVAAAGNFSLNLNNPTEVTKLMNELYGAYGYQFSGASLVFPAAMPGVLTVASSVKWTTEKTAYYSDYGARTIDVAVPGGDNGPAFDTTHDPSQADLTYNVLGAWPTYFESSNSGLVGYQLWAGTSLATPKVSAIAALIKVQNPELSPSQVAERIRQTANDYGKQGTDQYFGAGEANAYNALKN